MAALICSNSNHSSTNTMHWDTSGEKFRMVLLFVIVALITIALLYMVLGTYKGVKEGEI